MQQKLHSIMFSCAPQMEAILTYNIPFYYYFGQFCYMNAKADGFDLGFCLSAFMVEHPLLGWTELKEVSIIYYTNLQKIQKNTLSP